MAKYTVRTGFDYESSGVARRVEVNDVLDETELPFDWEVLVSQGVLEEESAEVTNPLFVTDLGVGKTVYDTDPIPVIETVL